MGIEARIKALGYELPESPNPVANYVSGHIVGRELRTSGQIPIVNGELLFEGRIPSEQSVEQGIEAAKICGLNGLAVASQLLDGQLDLIERVLQCRVFVASDQGFTQHSAVANGVSDFMVEIFGDAGRHIRVAMGSIGLPLGATVEVEFVFLLKKEMP